MVEMSTFKVTTGRDPYRVVRGAGSKLQLDPYHMNFDPNAREQITGPSMWDIEFKVSDNTSGFVQYSIEHVAERGQVMIGRVGEPPIRTPLQLLHFHGGLVAQGCFPVNKDDPEAVFRFTVMNSPRCRADLW